MHIPINVYATTVPFPVIVWFSFEVLTIFKACLFELFVVQTWCILLLWSWNAWSEKIYILEQFCFLKKILGTV